MSANPDDFFRYATVSNGNSDDTTDYLKDVFTYLNYTFFTIQPNNYEVRVVRFCQQGRGSILGSGFSSQFEIKLRCRTENQDISSSSSTFRQTSQGPMIFLTVNTMVSMGLVRQEVCSFSVDKINQKMTEKITDCVNGIGLTGIGSQNNRNLCPTHFTSPQRQQIINVSSCLQCNVLEHAVITYKYLHALIYTHTIGPVCAVFLSTARYRSGRCIHANSAHHKDQSNKGIHFSTGNSPGQPTLPVCRH